MRRVEAERRCVALVGGGCLAPVAAYHDGETLTALIAAEDGSVDRAPLAATIRRRSRPSCSPLRTEARLMRIVVTRPAGQEEDLVDRLEQLGHEVVHCPLIEIEPLGDEPIDVAGYDWVVVTSANGARELRRRARRAAAACRRDRAAPRRRRSAAPTSSPAVSTQEGLLAELPRPAGRVLFAAAEGARRAPRRTRSTPTSSRSTEPASSTPTELPAATSSCWPRPRLRGRSQRSTTGLPVVSIGPETSRAAREAGLEVVAEAAEHSSDGLAAAVATLAAGPTGDGCGGVDSANRCSSRSSPTSGSRTTSSARATA